MTLRIEPRSPSRPWLRAGLELSVAALLLSAALAALTGSPAIEACAVAILAIGLAHAIMLRSQAADAAGHDYAMSYLAAALLFVLASGVTLALAVRGGTTRATDWPLAMELGGLAVLVAAFGGWFVWNLRDLAGAREHWPAAFAKLLFTDPNRATGLITAVIGGGASFFALAVVLDTWVEQQPAFEVAGAWMIAVLLTVAALFFASLVRMILNHTKVAPHVLKALTAAIGAAADKSGAIRQVLDIQARHGPQGTVVATVSLRFKDGVSASHVAPVLATLQKAASEAVPEVSAVVLGSEQTPATKD